MIVMHVPSIMGGVPTYVCLVTTPTADVPALTMWTSVLNTVSNVLCVCGVCVCRVCVSV